SSGCGASRPSLSATDEKGAFRPLSAPGPRGRSADVAHAEADATLTVDLEHLDLDDIAFLKLVADPLHALVGDLRDVHEAVLARQNRDEGSEVHQANHLALVDPADLDLGGDHLDALFRCTPRSRVDRRDLDRAVVLDVDLGAGLLADRANDRTALADDISNLLGIDLHRDDARRPVGHLLARLVEHLVHLAENVQPRFARLLERLRHDVARD